MTFASLLKLYYLGKSCRMKNTSWFKQSICQETIQPKRLFHHLQMYDPQTITTTLVISALIRYKIRESSYKFVHQCIVMFRIKIKQIKFSL